MTRRLLCTFARLAPAAALAALAGCVSTTPTFDAEFGTSVRALAVQQTRDPQASAKNANRPVDGMDGRAARETITQYNRSFAEPAREPGAFTIGIGQGGAR